MTKDLALSIHGKDMKGENWVLINAQKAYCQRAGVEAVRGHSLIFLRDVPLVLTLCRFMKGMLIDARESR